MFENRNQRLDLNQERNTLKNKHFLCFHQNMPPTPAVPFLNTFISNLENGILGGKGEL